MSAVNYIGRKTENGAEYIYCHWGGYMDQNAQILYDHYDDEDKVNELLSLGDASFIEPTIKKSKFYARDNGEVKARLITDVNSKHRPNVASNYDLCFLWTKGEWWVSGLANNQSYQSLPENPWFKVANLKGEFKNE